MQTLAPSPAVFQARGRARRKVAAREEALEGQGGNLLCCEPRPH